MARYNTFVVTKSESSNADAKFYASNASDDAADVFSPASATACSNAFSCPAPHSISNSSNPRA